MKLIEGIDLAIEYYFSKTPYNFSIKFLECLNNQLSIEFEKLCNVKINKHISLAVDDLRFEYEKNIISRLKVVLYVNHNWHYPFVCWKSNSGQIYSVEDANIDCDNIVFWFENLDTILCYNQMNIKRKNPFKVKNLNFKLEVKELRLDCTLELFSNGVLTETISIDLQNSINQFISNFNEESESNQRKKGVIHSVRYETKLDINCLEVLLDVGSAGVTFFNSFLQYLSSLNKLEKVVID